MSKMKSGLEVTTMPCISPQPGACARIQNNPKFPVIQLRLAKTVLP